ncbi:MAG: helix-turn-helix transcriptional regulator [Bryobacteraceae bacterium]
MDRATGSPPAKRRATRDRNATDRRERQIVRVLALLRVLSQGGTPSVHELAAEFQTRRETIYRDLRVLQDAGYPVTGDDRGRLSHPKLLPVSVPEIRFSSSELEALHAAAQQVQVAVPTSEALGTATLKVEALIRAERRPVSLPLGDLIESWTCGAKEYRLHEAHIAILVEAILRLRRCHVEYRKPSAANSKSYDFDPYRLLLVGGGLYVVGRVPTESRVI